jgi:hypothetical protein
MTMRKLLRGSLLGLTLAVFIAAVGQAGEEKVPLDKLPKPVVDAVKAKFPKAKMESAVKSTADGKTMYEVTLKAGALGIDVTLTDAGKITQIERELEAKDVPKVVAEALEKKYPQAAVKRIEELSKDNKIVSYEMLIDTAAKKTLEVYFDPAGKFLQEKDVTPKKVEKS